MFASVMIESKTGGLKADKSTYFDDLKSAELVLTEIKVKWKQAEVYEIIMVIR
ncbi:hypothetical protein [Proteus vulgaris]|uniref:hypothetical protein n=1 Tax=Proteus vulgaris TaxID=585 RepID=UPI0015F17F0A|nr:hypothetical protein [Proteus vulgaris]